MNLDPGSASITWVMITAGHNFLLISQQTISEGNPSQPDEKVITAAIAATVDALARATAPPHSETRAGRLWPMRRYRAHHRRRWAKAEREGTRL